MKTKEELNALKEEIKSVNNKLRELNEDELKEILGAGQKCEHFDFSGITVEDWIVHEYEVYL